MSDAERMENLARLTEAATPGPWRAHTDGGSYPTDAGTEWWSEVIVTAGEPDDTGFLTPVCQLGEGEDSQAARWWIHNLVAHPLLVLCPPLGEWLHKRTEPS